MLIDMHAHVVPDSIRPPSAGIATDRWPVIDRSGDVPVLVMGQTRFNATPLWWDVEQRTAASEAAGVDMEVVSPLPTFLNYGFPPRAGLDYCRAVNEWLARFCEYRPRRFYPLGIVPMQAPEAAAAELEGLKREGFVGVEVASNIAGKSLGEPQFVEFFQEAERTGMCVFVHGLGPTFAERYPQAAGAGFGIAAEIGVAAVSLVASGLAETCPRLRLAFSHGAGGFPLMLTRAQYFWSGAWNEGPQRPDFAARPNQAAVSPAESARKFYYDSLVFDRRALRYLVDMLGPERLLIGTDFPAMQREERAGDTLRSLGLPQAQVDAICWDNCFRFIGVEQPAGK